MRLLPLRLIFFLYAYKVRFSLPAFVFTLMLLLLSSSARCNTVAMVELFIGGPSFVYPKSKSTRERYTLNHPNILTPTSMFALDYLS
jgi:hypothetical protein